MQVYANLGAIISTKTDSRVTTVAAWREMVEAMRVCDYKGEGDFD